MKRILRLLLIITACFSLISCGDDEPENSSTKSIEDEQSITTLTKDNFEQYFDCEVVYDFEETSYSGWHKGTIELKYYPVKKVECDNCEVTIHVYDNPHTLKNFSFNNSTSQKTIRFSADGRVNVLFNAKATYRQGNEKEDLIINIVSASGAIIE